jgi:carbamoyltransferase
VAPYTDIDIGGFWTHCTKEIFGLSGGYPKGHQAGTVMAMAALGDPTGWEEYFLKTGMRPDTFVHKSERDAYYDAVKVTKEDEWWGTVPPSKIKKIKDLLDNSIDFNKIREIAEENEQNKFNIAAGIQAATEKIVRSIISSFAQQNISRNLCLSGGVALNSVLVGKIREWFKNEFDNIYVPPVPYDAGLAIGSAQYVWHHVLENDRIKWNDNATPYLGEVYSNVKIHEAISKFDNIQSVESNDNEVLAHLSNNKIVAVFRGGSESGRRALGNRSILADPRSQGMKDLINEKVKHRQWFRPFAPSILREEVKNWFTEDIDSPYMSFVIKFKDDVINKVPAVVHFDKTARLQTVSRSDNKWYHSFLIKWKEVSGVPILLNTSFNDREPIVESPEDAIRCFLSTDIDFLYFVDAKILINKRKT